MIIVVNLLKSIYVISFIVFLFLEVLVLLSLIFLNKNPITSNFEEVKLSVQDNTKNIVETIKYLIVRKTNNIRMELLSTGKHMRPYILGWNRNRKFIKSVKYDEFEYNMNSSFFKNFNNEEKCLIYDLKTFFSKEGFLSSVNDYDAGVQINNLYKLKDYSNADPMDNITEYFEKEAIFNSIAYLGKRNSKNNEYSTLLCFWLMIVKSHYDTNIHNENLTTTIERYMFFLDNGDLAVFPPENLSDTAFNNLPYANNISNCLNRKDYRDCFRTFSLISLPDNIKKNQIYFDQPVMKYDNSGFVIRGCIALDLEEGSGRTSAQNDEGSNKIYKYSYVCIDFSFNHLTDSLQQGITSNNFFFFFSNIFNSPNDDDYKDLITYTTLSTDYRNYLSNKNLYRINDFDIFFSSKIMLNKINPKIFNYHSLNQYQLDLTVSSLKKLRLFHGLYDQLFDSFSLISEDKTQVDNLMNEYMLIVDSIKNNINNISVNNSCSNYENKNSTIQELQISYLDNTIEFGSWKRSVKLLKEGFMISVTPVNIHYNIYDEKTFTYNITEVDCSPKTLFFIFSFSLTGNSLLHTKIYYVLVLKLIRTYFLFSAAILFLKVVFFI
jgi:hypothetical protein